MDEDPSVARRPPARLRRWATSGLLAGIVYISTSLTGTAVAGTGMVIDPDGVITTSSDVVAGAERIEVRAEGSAERFRAEVVGEEDGFAILRVVDPDSSDPDAAGTTEEVHRSTAR